MIAGNAAIAIALVGYLSVFVPAIDMNPFAATGSALALIWVLVLINCYGRPRTPAAGLCLSSLLVTVLVLMNFTAGLVEQFTFVVLLATLTALLPYLVCALARIALGVRERDRSLVSRLDLAVAGFGAGFGAGFAAWAIVGTGANAVLWGLALLAAGLPVYLWLRIRRPTAEAPA
jgi:basic amino acid/polyamine antiporter, APA family